MTMSNRNRKTEQSRKKLKSTWKVNEKRGTILHNIEIRRRIKRWCIKLALTLATFKGGFSAFEPAASSEAIKPSNSSSSASNSGCTDYEKLRKTRT